MKVAVAALVATTIAVLMAVPRIAGIETWKWVLGLLGVALVVLAGRKK